MTEKEFLAALAECSKEQNMRWSGVENNYPFIRTRDSSQGHYHCPITFVAECKTGKGYVVSSFNQAADAIGLTRLLTSRIVGAADGNIDRKTLRKKLIKAITSTSVQ